MRKATRPDLFNLYLQLPSNELVWELDRVGQGIAGSKNNQQSPADDPVPGLSAGNQREQQQALATSETRRLRLIVEYDGSDYAGFQWQTNAPTIQAELEKAIARITQEAVRVTGAGRTDAGVHALGQVAHFDTTTRLDEATLLRALNAVLPPAIAIRSIERVPANFHARFSARSRHYRYTIYNAPVRSPLAARFAALIIGPLDADRMQTAANLALGTHNFAAFATGPVANPVRTIQELTVTRENHFIKLDFHLDAGFAHLIRRLTGSLIQVGSGRLTQEEFAAILASADPSRGAPPAPPQGLCLIAVAYDPELRRRPVAG